MIVSVVRTVIIYIVLIGGIRLMGKRQIGQMEPSELVVTMLVADLAASPIQDGELSVWDAVVCLVEYMPDGSTHNMIRQYYRNPNGFRYGRLVTLSGPNTLKGKLKTYIHYTAESILAGKPILKDAPSKLLCLLSLPFGAALAAYIRYRCK